MAIVQMQKVAVISHRSLRDDVLDTLQQQGVLEVSQTTQPVATDHTEVRFREAEVQFAIATLKEAASKETLLAARRKATEKDILAAANHTDVLGIVEELRKLEESDTAWQHEIQENQKLLDSVRPWAQLPYNLKDPRGTEFCIMQFGTIPEKNLSSLQETIQFKLPRTHFEHIHTENGTAFIAAELWRDDTQLFEELTTTHGWSDISLPELSSRTQGLHSVTPRRSTSCDKKGYIRATCKR